MVTGFFQTVLLLPREDYSEQELEMIIRHELVHYKRHDIAYKMLLMFAVAVHWFNPLVWIMTQEANKDSKRQPRVLPPRAQSSVAEFSPTRARAQARTQRLFPRRQREISVLRRSQPAFTRKRAR